jgi:fibronectin type 3 domain-containing protein
VFQGITAAIVPANAVPVATLGYTDPVEADGRQRCYTVRSVVGIGAQAIESDPSERVCVTPIDVDPPLAPTNLEAIVGDGFIELIWEPNGEEDLGGYIVLRAEPRSDTLLQLTAAPISATRFTDRSVTAGVRYTYIVRAVDSRVPLPNQSAPAETSATAR